MATNDQNPYLGPRHDLRVQPKPTRLWEYGVWASLAILALGPCIFFGPLILRLMFPTWTLTDELGVSPFWNGLYTTCVGTCLTAFFGFGWLIQTVINYFAGRQH